MHSLYRRRIILEVNFKLLLVPLQTCITPIAPSEVGTKTTMPHFYHHCHGSDEGLLPERDVVAAGCSRLGGDRFDFIVSNAGGSSGLAVGHAVGRRIYRRLQR
eukprot:scaffold120910_cov52-Prasinocladus_malaysianus.AAC.2